MTFLKRAPALNNDNTVGNQYLRVRSIRLYIVSTIWCPVLSRKCSVENCGKEGVHELSYEKAKVLEEQGIKLIVYGARPPRRPGHVYLCDEHYKLWKKLSRKMEKIEKFVRKGA